jgi:L-malate glycosyltransferase
MANQNLAERHAEDRIRVLFLMIQMQMGGAERLILDLARSLDRRVFAPAVAWLVDEPALAEFGELGIPLFNVPKGPGFDWRAMRRLAKIVKAERIDVVNAHHFMPFVYSYYASKVTRMARLVYTEHSESDVRSAAGAWRVVGSCLVASCDAAVGVSDGVARTLRSQFPLRPGRIHAIENGVDIQRFAVPEADKEELRQRYGLSSTDVVVGIVANLKKNKNHLFLLRAFREVCQLRPEARLVIVGQGFPGDPQGSEQDILRFVSANGLKDRVHLLGHQRNVAELLRVMDVFCLVSHKEGLPISLIEAMAAGLPVIGTDIEGIRAVVEPGVHGWLVTPDDVQALADKLNRLIGDGDLRRRFGRASRDLAQDSYSLDRCVARTEGLFLSVVPPARRRHFR